ncbi:metalloprotease MEP1 [Diaporthe amygdali]|uniref:metalloprotease MEP1 n=1 Tax=Phomopsis amygdali TaxID=1214568 RepID=UPI0022FEB25D|nr:metalloprotease MEP1 [Diaporthe amygdali]KAJ0122475.1 metalloprotease MEP1 [Diaporthe amygdali]
MFMRVATASIALLFSLGTSPVLALQCLNDDLATVEPMGVALPMYTKRQEEPTAVDVYFHVTSTEANKDRITDDIVDAQFDVLHSTFLDYGFELKLVNVSRLVDDVAGKGFYADDGIEIVDFDAYVAWRTQTRRGGYDALNVYFFTDLNDGIGGYCNTPTVVEDGSQYFYLDGCWVNGDSMPGLGRNETAPPNKGHAAIHEVGHWFGLLHTFHGRPCESINDQVADTPAQSGSSLGCPVGRDSCPDSPGLDPIHNFMDYSDDTCTTEFTPGQSERMHQQFGVYRRWQG